MDSLVYLVPLALLLGGTALAAFLWSLGSGQYEDLDGAAERILLEEDDKRSEPAPADGTEPARHHEPRPESREG